MKLLDLTMTCPRCKGCGKVQDPRAVGEHMRSKREEKRLSLRSVAKAAKITPAYLSDMELGRRNFTPEMLMRVGRLLEGGR
jgi:plasmid maintenance system antidote protein VapI